MIETITINNYKLVNEFLIKNNLEPLSLNSFNSNPFLKIAIYKKDDVIAGYLNFSIIYENAEINQIFVEEKYRKQKIASKLIEHLLKECINCSNITLEVRESNIAAINLYEKFKFKKCAIRNNYYGNENGILMVFERSEK